MLTYEAKKTITFVSTNNTNPNILLPFFNKS